MRILLSGIVAIALSLGMTGGIVAAAGLGTSPSSPMTLVSTQSGNLTGSTTGSFSYYTFDYPGGGPVGTLDLSFAPADPSTANAVGVDLYQNGSLIGNMNGVSPTPGFRSLTFSSPSAGPVLVQVYNYTAGTPVDFQVGLTGIGTAQPPVTLPASTIPAASAPAAPSPVAESSGSSSSPTNPPELTGPMSGSLLGDVGGAYAYYTIPNSGGTHSVTISFSPHAIFDANGFYVVFYQNGAEIGSAHGVDASSPGNLTASYQSNTSGPVLVQIGNYTPNDNISYTISP